MYRGSALGAAYRGRYFFADFVARRVWSIGLDFSSGSAVAVGLLEHTAELGGSAALGGIASFGVDAAGELYIASFNGTIIRILPAVRTPNPIMTIDTPANGASVRQPFLVAGWAIDATSPAGTGMGTAHHVWAFPLNGAAPMFAGVTTANARPDVAAYFGSQFAQSGYGLVVSGLAPGAYRLAIYGWVNALANFGVARTVDVTVGSTTLLVIDAPSNGASVGRPFILAGWAIDTSAPSGTGVDGIHVWAFPVAGGPPTFVGTPVLGGSRPDVGGYFGSRFTPSGYNMVANLPPGRYRPQRLRPQLGDADLRHLAGGARHRALTIRSPHASVCPASAGLPGPRPYLSIAIRTGIRSLRPSQAVRTKRKSYRPVKPGPGCGSFRGSLRPRQREIDRGRPARCQHHRGARRHDTVLRDARNPVVQLRDVRGQGVGLQIVRARLHAGDGVAAGRVGCARERYDVSERVEERDLG